jgi:hypothetical protein
MVQFLSIYNGGLTWKKQKTTAMFRIKLIQY